MITVITDDFLKIFVPSNKIQSSIEAPARNVFMPTILLNDSVYQSLKWLSITKNNGQTGLETVIGIKKLKSDLYSLTIMAPADTTKIPFWKP